MYRYYPQRSEFESYLWREGNGFDWRWVLGISFLLSLLCLALLVRSRTPWYGKLAWAILVLFPVAGPLMYAALFRPPPRQDESVQGKPTDGIYY